MLAKRVQLLPVGKQWEYEVKFDGYRIEAIKNGAKVRLLSRRGNDFTKRFAKVVEAVSKINADSVLIDGEVVAVDEKGRPSFQVLQNRARLPAKFQLLYYAFDLLHLNGEDLRRAPLKERRARLEKTLKGTQVRFSSTLEGPMDVLTAVCGSMAWRELSRSGWTLLMNRVNEATPGESCRSSLGRSL